VLKSFLGHIRYQVINRHAIGFLIRLIPLVSGLTPPQYPWEEYLIVLSFEIITKLVMDQFVKLKSRHLAFILQSLTQFFFVEHLHLNDDYRQPLHENTINIDSQNVAITKDSLFRSIFTANAQQKQCESMKTSNSDNFFMEDEDKNDTKYNFGEINTNGPQKHLMTTSASISPNCEDLIQEIERQSCIPYLRAKQKISYILSERVFLAIYHMLYACAKTRQYETFKVIAPFLEVIKFLLRQIVKVRAIRGQSSTSLTQCAQNFSRLLEEMSHNKAVMKKYAVYLILDYIQLLTREAVPKDIKDSLLNGIYALLDVCTEYEYPAIRKDHI